ncbi:MAG: UDP-N-acetylmuramate--L-alanine ligase [Phycisphaerae bacterium]|nr:UDP-N-acetylmuramate--L-alanine ligase [Phycisphaerae bacterium]
MTQSARTRRLSSGKLNAEALYPPVGAGDAAIPAAGPLTCPGSGSRVHMVGVGGCGMRGAAAVLLRRGVRVSGSDLSDSAELGALRAAGGEIHIGQGAENVPADCDLVVCSAAVKDVNPEVVAARERGCAVVKYSQLLGLLMADRLGVGVAGTHGKSTTTAMTAFVLRQASMDPCFVIGAQVEQLGGGSGVGDGPHFVVEACEYDRSFLNLHPRYAAILNIEEDHLDYYKDLDEIIGAFQAFAGLVPESGVLVVNGEDGHALRAVRRAVARVETFGLSSDVNWRAELQGTVRGCWRFTVLRDGKPLTDVQLAIPGKHQVSNALAAMALCLHGGVEPETIAKALGDFKGAYRRLTWRGCVHGVNVVDDYAHHPTELQVTIRAAREYYRPRKMFVVFQPHQHSRTRFLLDDFAHSFQDADVVVVPDIYFVRDSQAERELVDAEDLVRRIGENGRDARYEGGFGQIVSQLCGEVEPGDLVVTMGAGDVWRVADGLLDCLTKRYGG